MALTAFDIVTCSAYIGVLVSIPLNLTFMSIVRRYGTRQVRDHRSIFMSFSILGLVMSVLFFICQPVLIMHGSSLYVIFLGFELPRPVQLVSYVIFRLVHTELILLVPICVHLRYFIICRKCKMSCGLTMGFLFVGLIISVGVVAKSVFDIFLMGDLHADENERHIQIVNDFMFGQLNDKVFYVDRMLDWLWVTELKVFLCLGATVECMFLQWRVDVKLGRTSTVPGHRVPTQREVASCLRGVSVVVSMFLFVPIMILYVTFILRKDAGVYMIPTFLGSAFVPVLVPYIILGKIHSFRRGLSHCLRKDKISHTESSNTHTID